MFIKAIQSDFDISKSVHQEFAKKSEGELKELKVELDKERNNNMNKLALLEREKLECNFYFYTIKINLVKN